MEKFTPIKNVESFLAMPNDVYTITFNSLTNSKVIDVKISVPSFSIITIDWSVSTFSVLPVNDYSDVDNVFKTNG